MAYSLSQAHTLREVVREPVRPARHREHANRERDNVELGMALEVERRQGGSGNSRRARRCALSCGQGEQGPENSGQTSVRDHLQVGRHKDDTVTRRIRSWPARIGVKPLHAAFLVAVLVLGACGGSRARKGVKLPPPINPRLGWSEVGTASWYGHPYHGRKTANGETYNMNEMTAAHKRLPFDTWLTVKNLSNGKITRVRINDRGPFVGKRIIDLSRAAAADIQMIGTGTARVRLTVIRPPAGARRARAPVPARGTQEGRFDIQIGVFASQANARALAKRANGKGHSAVVREFSQSGSKRFRVLVLGGSRQQATSRIAKLKSQGFAAILRPRRDT